MKAGDCEVNGCVKWQLGEAETPWDEVDMVGGMDQR